METTFYSTGITCIVSYFLSEGHRTLCVANRIRFRLHREHEIMEELHLIDTELLIDSPTFYKRQKVILLAVCVVAYAWHFGESSAYSIFGYKSSGWYELLDTFTFVIQSLMVIHFVNWITVLRLRFNRINELLLNKTLPKITHNYFGYEGIGDKSLWCTVKAKHRLENMSKMSPISVDTLRKCHMKLIEVSEHIAGVYGICNVAFFSEVCFRMVVLSFFCFTSMAFGTTANIVSCLPAFSAIVRIFFKVFAVCFACEWTGEEANRTTRIVQKLRSEKNHSLDHGQLVTFSEQLRHSHLEFSACGLLTINAKVLSGFITAVVTYVLLLLQFVISEKDKSDGQNKTL